MNSQLSVIGLDGATFRLILPWVQEGKLPNFKKIMETGVWGGLESTLHPLSPQAWASFMTGKNPGKHGIFEFAAHRPNSYDLRYVNGGSVQGRKLWEILSEGGRRVCVMNVPFTYPPVPVNGCLIAGLDAPGVHSGFCHPPDLLNELTDKFGEYQLREHPYGATPEGFLKKILAQFDYILDVALYLKAKEVWDLFVVVFESTDLVQHFYWHYAFPEQFGLTPFDSPVLQDAILNVYVKIDQGLGRLLDLCGTDENVIIMSDHGFSPCRKVFFMDNWLQQQGYLNYSVQTGGTYAVTRLIHRAFQRNVPNHLKQRIVSKIPGLKDRVRSYLTTATIDWQKTRAFSLGIDSTNIFINLEGKFPQGTVRAGKEYEDLRDEIACRLKRLVDPDDGQRIVQEVYKREALYSGANLMEAPDLLVTWKDFEYNTRRGYDTERDSLFGSSLEYSDVSGYSSLQKSGTHHLEGIFLGQGRDFKNGGRFYGAKIIDLAPTILYLLGAGIPEDMDGRVLEEIITEGFVAGNPRRQTICDPVEDRRSSSGYGDGEEDYIRDKLRGLGYID